MVSKSTSASTTLEIQPAIDNGKRIIFDAGGQFGKGWINPFTLDYGKSKYELESITFYDIHGDVRFTERSGWFSKHFRSGNPYRTMALMDGGQPAKVKRKQGPDFSLKEPHFTSKKDTYSKGLRAHLYLPVDYLESLGWRMIEETHHSEYRTHIKKYLQVGPESGPLFDLYVNSETYSHFDEAKKDFLNALQEATDAHDLIQVIDQYKYKF